MSIRPGKNAPRADLVPKLLLGNTPPRSSASANRDHSREIFPAFAPLSIALSSSRGPLAKTSLNSARTHTSSHPSTGQDASGTRQLSTLPPSRSRLPMPTPSPVCGGNRTRPTHARGTGTQNQTPTSGHGTDFLEHATQPMGADFTPPHRGGTSYLTLISSFHLLN